MQLLQIGLISILACGSVSAVSIGTHNQSSAVQQQASISKDTLALYSSIAGDASRLATPHVNAYAAQLGLLGEVGIRDWLELMSYYGDERVADKYDPMMVGYMGQVLGAVPTEQFDMAARSVMQHYMAVSPYQRAVEVALVRAVVKQHDNLWMIERLLYALQEGQDEQKVTRHVELSVASMCKDEDLERRIRPTYELLMSPGLKEIVDQNAALGQSREKLQQTLEITALPHIVLEPSTDNSVVTGGSAEFVVRVPRASQGTNLIMTVSKEIVCVDQKSVDGQEYFRMRPVTTGEAEMTIRTEGGAHPGAGHEIDPPTTLTLTLKEKK
jgi:hypothetical protein